MSVVSLVPEHVPGEDTDSLHLIFVGTSQNHRFTALPAGGTLESTQQAIWNVLGRPRRQMSGVSRRGFKVQTPASTQAA